MTHALPLIPLKDDLGRHVFDEFGKPVYEHQLGWNTLKLYEKTVERWNAELTSESIPPLKWLLVKAFGDHPRNLGPVEGHSYDTLSQAWAALQRLDPPRPRNEARSSVYEILPPGYTWDLKTNGRHEGSIVIFEIQIYPSKKMVALVS